MPIAVFRCSSCATQTSVQLTYLKREVDAAGEQKIDVLRPRPKCGRPGCPRRHRVMDEVKQLDDTEVAA